MSTRIHTSRLLRAAMLATVIGLASSCAPKEPPTSKEIQQNAIPATIPTVWGDAAKEGGVPDGWLKSFKDPGLEAVVGEAMKNNLDLRGSKAKLDRAAAEAMSAGAALSPVVSASGAGAASGGSEANRQNARGAGLNVSWEPDVWGRIRQQVGAAELQYEGAQLDYEFARQSVAAGTAKAWFLASETYQQKKLATEQVATYQEMLRITESRRAAGKLGEQDVRLVKADLASAQNREAAAVAAHNQAVRALEVLLGRFPSSELAIAPAFPEMPEAVPAGIPSEVLERRPDIAAADRRVKSAFRNVEAKKLAKLPSFGLSAGAGVSSGLAGMTGQGGEFFNVGANFFAPILDGGALESQVKIATADQESALAAYGQTALRAFKDVQDALESETTLAKREALQEETVKHSEEAVRLRKVEVDAGKADMLTLLQLQASVDISRSGLITLRQARRSERVNLHLSLGGGFEAAPATAPTTVPATASK